MYQYMINVYIENNVNNGSIIEMIARVKKLETIEQISFVRSYVGEN